ncbi:XTP/dITP diphosphatase [Papillibacter cinnamivorans]|uniref:dITP/XTP pyrophosphatase n=1 Tax=Papillibacter cinnamivorans DSM 12816 TaxID=1122930 RepID=A0A1W1ZET9_9FIRM|nr:XTP/dITP diphosphatase [Papillibacter cinnamivorans]SMC46671.1 XTP/dITP diphosphohydrolase [Papillibacter cinnamivorans DSM 12816]
MKLILASNNRHKLAEMRAILEGLGIQVMLQSEAGISTNPEETGETFEENALIKARAASEASNLPAVADDSGLMVDALGGKPGVYSARYGGEGLSDRERWELLLRQMEGEENRRCRFVSAIACVFPGGDTVKVRGECRGELLREPRGSGGFGYDPVFYIPELRRTMAELTPEEKNRVSHRARALNQFLEELRKYHADR